MLFNTDKKNAKTKASLGGRMDAAPGGDYCRDYYVGIITVRNEK